MKRRKILSILKASMLVVISAGWLLPFFLGIDFYLSWAGAELGPRIQGANPMNSFPFIRASGEMFAIGLGWAAVAIGIWTILLHGHLSRRITTA